MSLEILTSGLIRVVFETAGVAPPVILALIASIVLMLEDVSLNPPLAM